jgi:hypothetical protein
MSNTGTVIASAVVGALIGFGAAKLTTPPAPCADQLIVVDPAGPVQIPDRCVSKSKGHRVTWTSSTGAPVEVVWTGIENPPTAPLPYTFDCKTAPTANCASGPISAVAVVKSAAKYSAKILPGGPVMNGRIIIDR